MPVQSFMHPVEGIDWYCQQQGDGPAVVLVPSGEGDCAPFDPVAARLADQFRVLTFDMPGFSRTGAPPGNVQLAAILGIQVGLLPCKHFPQVSIPDRLADHIRRSASPHLS
jgi:hypothetical protein